MVQLHIQSEGNKAVYIMCIMRIGDEKSLVMFYEFERDLHLKKKVDKRD